MRMAGKFNSSSYHMEVYLLTMLDRSFGGSSEYLGVFSSLGKIDGFVRGRYSNEYTVEPHRIGYSLKSSMTELILLIRKFELDKV